MAIFAPIPNVGNGMDAFYSGMTNTQNIFDSLMKNRLEKAQAKHAEAMANLPFGGADVPGPAGQIVGLEMVRQQYGENSPQYQMAKRSFDLNQSSDQSRINYQNALAGSTGIRYTTPEGRGLIEQSNVSQGFSPSGTPQGSSVVPGAPGYKSPYATPEEASGQYELERIKKNVPNTELTSSIRGTNAEQTLDKVNVDDLTQYSGLEGGANLIKDRAKSAVGMTSEKYKKFEGALTNAQLLAKQYRQMMGDSITPSNQEALGFITNPTSWILHPDVAKEKFNTFAQTLKRENKVFKGATKNADVYTGKNQESTNQNENLEGHEPSPGTIWMIRPDGKQVEVHQENVDIAKNKYGFKDID